MNIYDLEIKPMISLRVPADSQEDAVALAQAWWNNTLTRMYTPIEGNATRISQTTVGVPIAYTENGRALRCNCCGKRLEEGKTFDCDLPLSRGNPYPGTLTVCDDPACHTWATVISAPDEETEDDEDDY